jgi:hypothetical protein
MTKRENLDCVAVKRRAQRRLVAALAGKSPAEQAELLQRLAARTPLWQQLVAARPERTPRAVRPRRKRRAAG